MRVRGQAIAEVAPQARLRSAEVSAYWSASENVDWEGAVGYDSSGRLQTFVMGLDNQIYSQIFGPGGVPVTGYFRTGVPVNLVRVSNSLTNQS